MSWEESTYGTDCYRGFLKALQVLGVAYEEQPSGTVHDFSPYDDEPEPLRLVRFHGPAGEHLIAEEYIATVTRYDDGRSTGIDIAVYPDGQRPELKTIVREDFGDDYLDDSAASEESDDELAGIQTDLDLADLYYQLEHGEDRDNGTPDHRSSH